MESNIKNIGSKIWVCKCSQCRTKPKNKAIMRMLRKKIRQQEKQYKEPIYIHYYRK